MVFVMGRVYRIAPAIVVRVAYLTVTEIVMELLSLTVQATVV